MNFESDGSGKREVDDRKVGGEQRTNRGHLKNNSGTRGNYHDYENQSNIKSTLAMNLL